MIEKLSYDALENMTEEELNQLKEKYIKEKETLKPYKNDYQYVDNMLSHIHSEEMKRNIGHNVGKCFKSGTFYFCLYDIETDYDFYEAHYVYATLEVDTDESELSIATRIIYPSEIAHYQSVTKEEFDEVYKNVATKLFESTKETKK